MKNLSTMLLVIFMGMFWIFRSIVALMEQMGTSLGGFVTFNFNIEIALLFLTILSFILIVKRNLIGALIYFLSYGYYFGGYLMTSVVQVLLSGGALSPSTLQNGFVALLGVILALCALLNIVLNKVKTKTPKDKKTDWFFQNEKFDRKYDERADKNQYRNY